MNKEVTILMKLQDRVSSGFRNISKSFGDAVRNMQTSVAGAKNAISDYVKGMQEGSEKARAFRNELKTIAVASGIVAGTVLLVAKSSFSAAIEMESLKLGLASVAGSAQEAEGQMKELHEIAKLPGLGLQEAIQGSTRLQAVGINAQLANKALMEFGNALARVGKGREELSGVILALTQIVGKGKVTAEEINQIAERVPEVRKVMMEAFGTASTEAIQKMNISAESFIETLVSGFEKLPRVIGGTRNEIENFNDAVYEAKVAVGQALLPVFTQVLGVLTKLVGWFNQLSNTTKSLITWSGVVVGGLAAITASFTGLGLALPALIAGMTVLTTTIIPALGSALLFLATNPIGLTITAIGLLAATLLALRADYNASIITVEKFSSSIGKLNDEMANVGQITGLAKELGELQSKTNLTQTESNRLYEVQAKLAEISPTLIRGYDEQGRALASSKKEIIDYAAEQYKLLAIEREILVLRAKQRAGELGKQLGKEVGTLEEMNKQLGEVGRQEYTVQTRFGELSTRSRARFISGMAEQAEKVRGLRQEYNALMNEIEQAEQQRGLRVNLPPLPKIDKTIILEEKEIAKIEKDILDARQETRYALAKLSGDEIKILEARHQKEIEDIDKRLAAIKGSSDAEVQLRQVLNQQKLALDRVFIGERNKILEEETQKDAKRLNEWVRDRVQAGVKATNAEMEELKKRRKAEMEELEKMLIPYLAHEEQVKSSIAKAAMKEIDDEIQAHKKASKIKIGITETYFKIHEARTAQHQKKLKELTDLGFEETIKDVRAGWEKLTAEEMPLGGWEKAILMIQDEFGGFVNVVKSGLEDLGVEFDEVTESAFSFFEALVSGNVLKIAGSGIKFIASMIDNMTGPGFGGFVIDWENLNQSIDDARTKIKALEKDLATARQYRGMGAMAVAIEREIETLEKTIVILEGRLAGINFAEALRPGLESSWTELWQSLFDPDSVLDPLESFADSVDEMIFKQLVDVFTKTPELMEQARKLGEYIAFSLNDGIISQTEKYEIDRYRALLVKEYEDNTKKLMTAVDVLDLQIRKSQLAKQRDIMDWMDFTKVGIFPEERGMAGIGLRDVLMKPQQTYLAGLESGTTAEETLASGKAPSISDVVGTKPGVTFVQNNQFSGLVNFDNPEAMRELARKLQPYTEELQENWVSG